MKFIDEEWDSKLVLLLAWGCTTKTFTERVVKQFKVNGNTIVATNEFGVGRVPRFLKKGRSIDRLFDVYPRLNYRHLLERLKGTEWDNFVPQNLIESYAFAQQKYSRRMSEPMQDVLRKTIEKLIETNFDDVVTCLLEEDSLYGQENLLLFTVENFLTPEQVRYVLNHELTKNRKHHGFVCESIAALRKWDDAYEYKDYPDEWLTETYGYEFDVIIQNYSLITNKPKQW